MKKPELLLPANNLEVLKVAIVYGADAVYIGGSAFGLRAAAKNFTLSEMKEAIEFAHSFNKKVYVTANIFAHNRDLEGIKEYFKELKDVKPDAVIISDPGVFKLAQEIMPEIDIHISTQANNTNYETYKFWYEQGAKRLVCARELSLEEIVDIKKNIKENEEIEVFIHGAMCISYSGRCLLSNYLAHRDANQGECTHPCRWKYNLVEETRPNEYMPIYENERGTYIFNSKDLCMIEHIPELIDAKIDSFKIEGRMKNALYVATMTRTYRKAIHDYCNNPKTYQSNLNWYKEEILKCTYRQYTTGFFFEKANENSQIYENNTYVKDYTFLGVIEKVENGLAVIHQVNKFCVNNNIELIKPNGETLKVSVKNMFDKDLKPIESAPRPAELIYVDLGLIPNTYDILRMKND